MPELLLQETSPYNTAARPCCAATATCTSTWRTWSGPTPETASAVWVANYLPGSHRRPPSRAGRDAAAHGRRRHPPPRGLPRPRAAASSWCGSRRATPWRWSTPRASWRPSPAGPAATTSTATPATPAAAPVWRGSSPRRPAGPGGEGHRVARSSGPGARGRAWGEVRASGWPTSRSRPVRRRRPGRWATPPSRS